MAIAISIGKMSSVENKTRGLLAKTTPPFNAAES